MRQYFHILNGQYLNFRDHQTCRTSDHLRSPLHGLRNFGAPLTQSFLLTLLVICGIKLLFFFFNINNFIPPPAQRMQQPGWRRLSGTGSASSGPPAGLLRPRSETPLRLGKSNSGSSACVGPRWSSSPGAPAGPRPRLCPLCRPRQWSPGGGVDRKLSAAGEPAVGFGPGQPDWTGTFLP